MFPDTSPSSSPALHRSNAYSYSTLPSHAPPIIVQNTTTLHDPASIASFAHAQRHREFNALVRRYIHQLLYGCKRSVCLTPTCATCRKQLGGTGRDGSTNVSIATAHTLGWGGRREFTPLSARIIACQLATADEPYRALCPGLEGNIRREFTLGGDFISSDGREGRKDVKAGAEGGGLREREREKVDLGMRDSKSFMQGLFSTNAARSLEMHVLPPPVDVVNVLAGRKDGESTNGRQVEGDEKPRTESKTEKDTLSTSASRPSQTDPYMPSLTTIGPEKDHSTTPHHVRPPYPLSTPPAPQHQHQPWTKPPSAKARRKLSHDLSSYLTSPKNPYFTPHVNEFTPTTTQQPQHVHRHHTRDMATLQKRSPETTPSRTMKHSAIAGDDRSSSTATTPNSVKNAALMLPQAVTHFNSEIVNALVEMIDAPSVSIHARREAEGFLRQSCYYVFGNPDNLAACFTDDDRGAKSLEVLESVKQLFDKGVGGDVVDALWKALGELFPSVEQIATDAKGGKRKIVKPSKYSHTVAAKVFVMAMHVMTAACPVGTPEMWEKCRGLRSRGMVCLDVSFEDDGLLRLASRFARCWYAYGMFASGVRDMVREYLLEYARLEKKVRLTGLEKELGPELAGEVIALGVGKGGWSLTVCTLEWMRAVMLNEWDGTERPKMGGVVDASIGVLKFLYEHHEKLSLEESYFHNQILADRLEYKDMPTEWYSRKPKPITEPTLISPGRVPRDPVELPHLLDNAFLFPPGALVKFFRSINFHRMSAAYDDAMAMGKFIELMTIPGGIELLPPWLLKFLLETQKVAMTVYMLLEVNRTSVLRDALDQLVGRELRECLRPLKVRFFGEEGVDHGGVQQEFFGILWEEATRGEYGCFSTDDRTRISWLSIVTLEPVHKFELLGLLVGLAIYNGVTLPVSFPLVMYRKLLGWKVGLDDLADGWPELVKGMRQLLDWKEEDGDVGDIFVRSYEFSYEALGEVQNVDLMRIGREDRWNPVRVEKTVKEAENDWLAGSIAKKYRAMALRPPSLLAPDAGDNDESDSVTGTSDDNQLQPPDITDSISTSDSSSRRILTPGSPSPSLSPSRRSSAVHIDENDEAAATWRAYHKHQTQSLLGQSPPHSSCSSTAPVKITSDQFIKKGEKDGEAKEEESELVTNANREQYVEDYVFWLTDRSVRPQFEAFDRGFHAVLDRKSLSLFNPSTLRHLVEGSKEIDISALEAAAKYDDGYHPNHRCIKDFWSIVRTYDEGQKRALLEFVTASDRIPVSGMQSVMFVIQRNGGDSERVPTSLTCFGRLLLPEYNSKKKMREKLRVALENGRGFGVP